MSKKLEDGELTFNEIWKKYGYTPPVPKQYPKHPLFQPHKNCFAYWDKDDPSKPKCSALNRMYCVYEVCHFYKTNINDVKGVRA